MRTNSTLVALLLAGCASAPPPPPQPVAIAEPGYAILLHRPSAIGDVRKRHTTMTAIESLIVRSDESLLKQQMSEIHITFVGTEKVLDIDEHGVATKNEYVVEEAFTEAQGGETNDLLPTGAVLVVTRGVGAPFALEDGSLTPETEKVLALLFTVTKPSRTDDDVFGSEGPQPIGGTWPIRAEVAARDLTEAGLAINTADLNGEVELTAVERVGNVECLMVSAHMRADTMIPPGLQSGDTVENAHMEASFMGSFPTDTSRRRLGDSSDMAAELTVLRSVEDRPVRTEMVIKRSQRTVYSEVGTGA